MGQKLKKMKQKNTEHILTPGDYTQVLGEIDKLMFKGEQNLTEAEMKMMNRFVGLVEKYEEQNKMVPVPRTAGLAKENDTAKITAVLGYEPDLIGLIEFKMYQLKMNQNGLAEVLHMPASKISQILNKKRDPDISFLKGIHEKLGIDCNYII